MNIELFDYELPDGYIAYNPARQRDASRLMILDRASGDITHAKFPAVVEYMNKGDALVVNNTKVFKARLIARRHTGGKVEIFLLHELDETDRARWKILSHPTRRVKEGEILLVDGHEAIRVIEKLPKGRSVIEFADKSEARRIISRYGHVPLPIYIHRPDKKSDENRYQTIYADPEQDKAVAAPTAGLHFTNRVLKKITDRGVKIIPITLHVGYGTFKPVKVEDIDEHQVDPEFAEIPASSAKAINDIRRRGGKIFAVGTTSVRTLESAEISDGEIKPMSRFVDLYIKPGHRFRVVDHLITNFHLPRSSLIILVSAFAGREKILEAYRTAVKEKYRFYSYGDCMLIM